MDNISAQNKNVSRREFIKTSATAAVSLAALTTGTTGLYAAGSDKFRVGLIGCGSRGVGALENCQEAAGYIGREIEIVALADAMEDRVSDAGKKFKIPLERCFSGFRAYRNVLKSDCDIVLIVTPPNFRPVQFEAAIKSGKHVFMEKPAAVDPPGARRIIAAGERAKEKGLSVVAGTQRRHQLGYLKNKYLVENGAIGQILGGNVWWCMQQLWYNTRQAGMSDAEYLVRNWVSFSEMSGDHIVEQHLHNLDVANWFIGHPPKKALGFGGRARRKTGNQYDFFSVDFDYGDGVNIHSMCRQVNGCYDRVSEFFRGSEGSITGDGKLITDKKSGLTAPNFKGHDNPYVQEHVDLLNSIVEGKPLNEARNVAESTLTAIMGRISAYTGQVVRWSDLYDNQNSQWYNLTLTPTAEDFETGNVRAPIDDVVPIPGKEKVPEDI